MVADVLAQMQQPRVETRLPHLSHVCKRDVFDLPAKVAIDLLQPTWPLYILARRQFSQGVCVEWAGPESPPLPDPQHEPPENKGSHPKCSCKYAVGPCSTQPSDGCWYTFLNNGLQTLECHLQMPCVLHCLLGAFSGSLVRLLQCHTLVYLW